MFAEPEARSGTRKPVVLAELRKDGLSDPSGSLPSASSKIGGLCRDQWKDGEVPAAQSSPPGGQAQLFRERQLGLPLRAGDSETLGLCPCPLGDPGQPPPPPGFGLSVCRLEFSGIFLRGLKLGVGKKSLGNLGVLGLGVRALHQGILGAAHSISLWVALTLAP